LVLGGGGFIGSHISEQLLLQGHQVTVFERPGTSCENLQHIKEHIKIINGDFMQETNFVSLLHNVDWVFHLVCTTLPANENVVSDIGENVIPTIKLLEACREVKVKKIIFISSGGTVYGPSEMHYMSETHPTDPVCAYGVQKLMIEKYLHLYHYLYGLDYAVLRVANPYGDRQNPFKPQGVIGVFLAQALLGRSIEIWGDGSVARDFLYVLDVAKAAVRVAEYEGVEKIFNIGSGKAYSLNTVIGCIEKVLDTKVNKNYLQGRKQDVPFNLLDIAKAKRELGWNPEVELADGIERMAHMWRRRFK